jgi:hypothetical protein
MVAPQKRAAVVQQQVLQDNVGLAGPVLMLVVVPSGPGPEPSWVLRYMRKLLCAAWLGLSACAMSDLTRQVEAGATRATGSSEGAKAWQEQEYE